MAENRITPQEFQPAQRPKRKWGPQPSTSIAPQLSSHKINFRYSQTLNPTVKGANLRRNPLRTPPESHRLLYIVYSQITTPR